MNRKNLFILLGISILFLLSSCRPSEPKTESLAMDWADPEIIKLLDIQDKRSAEDLIPFLNHEKANYRYFAANAAASMQDKALIPGLVKQLQNDTLYEDIRALSAYALGQIGDPSAIPTFTNLFRSEKSRKVQGAMLEAVGRCGDLPQLELLGNIKTYQSQDTALLTGLARGIYRFALRKKTSTLGTKKIIDILLTPGLDLETRTIASAYLQRAKDIDLKPFEASLNSIFIAENNPNAKMNQAVGLARTGGAQAFETLRKTYEVEKDYRVRNNIIGSLKHFSYEQAKDLALRASLDTHPMVALTAANYFKNNGTSEDAGFYFEEAQKIKHWRAKQAMLGAVIKNTAYRSSRTRNFFSNKIKMQYDSTSNVYEQAAMLTAIAENGFEFPFIAEKVFGNSHPAIRTTGMDALANIRQHKDFKRMFGTYYRIAENKIDGFLKQAVNSGDVAMMDIAAGVYRNPDLDYKSRLDSLDFISQAINKLELPRDTETAYSLQKTLDFLNGKPEKESAKPSYNHPIDMELLTKLTEGSGVEIKTAKGNIQLELYPDLAPGTVVNFARLVIDGYYNGKNVHRVVPNFVAQGGCPRGDGWGSESYSIRSEFSPLYYDDAGYIGMASAGKDTECAQWFITHSPTPHLDGRYTIFGKVTNGMDVVHQLEIGDLIEQIEMK